MKKITLAMALSYSILATSAWARDDSVYLEIDGGAVISDDFKFDPVDYPGLGNARLELGRVYSVLAALLRHTGTRIERPRSALETYWDEYTASSQRS